MSDYIYLFLIILALISVLMRADFVLTLIYLLLGVIIIGRWWSQRALQALKIRRDFNQRIFLGEKIRVLLEIENPSLLPAVWLQITDSFSVTLATPGFFQRVTSVGPKSSVRFEYELEGRRRGYYPIGPARLYSGDLFGVAAIQQRQLAVDYLTVYPRIIPLNQLILPSRSPMGTLRHHQPIFEDPTRIMGKRNYVSGDSLRRVDWKSTASTGRLQVKLYEPSIALETVILLNMYQPDYLFRTRVDASELGIVVAASLANWITGRRQSVGLLTNGIDPLNGDQTPMPVPPRRGRAHLMRVLDVLARVQLGETYPLVQLLRRETVNLSWGTTLILITPQVDEELFDALFQARRAGLNMVLIPCGIIADIHSMRRRAEQFGIPFFSIFDEDDLDIWRR